MFSEDIERDQWHKMGKMCHAQQNLGANFVVEWVRGKYYFFEIENCCHIGAIYMILYLEISVF